MNNKFYNATWFMWLTLIFFAPLGIFLMWKNKRFSLQTRKVLSVVFSVWLIFALAIGNSNNDNNYKTAVTQADKYFSDGDFSDAKKEYQTALSYKNDNSIEEKIALCSKLDESSLNYNDGEKYFEQKDYLHAYNSFKLVIVEDTKRYDNAQSKASESKKLYIDGELTEANNDASKSDYDHALKHINNVLSVNKDDVQAVKLKGDYQTVLNTKVEEQKRKDAEAKAQAEALAKAQAESAKQASQQIVSAPSTQVDNQSITVYVTKTGSKYHRDGCQYLRQSRIPISLDNAHAQGYGPCSKCNPPN